MQHSWAHIIILFLLNPISPGVGQICPNPTQMRIAVKNQRVEIRIIFVREKPLFMVKQLSVWWGNHWIGQWRLFFIRGDPYNRWQCCLLVLKCKEAIFFSNIYIPNSKPIFKQFRKKGKSLGAHLPHPGCYRVQKLPGYIGFMTPHQCSIFLYYAFNRICGMSLYLKNGWCFFQFYELKLL